MGPARLTDNADDRLEAWERRMNPVVISAAVLPIVMALTERGQSEPAVWLDLASWLVFIVDLVVHMVLKRGYLRTPLGRFDLVIVVLTAPWYVIRATTGVPLTNAFISRLLERTAPNARRKPTKGNRRTNIGV